MAFSNSITSAIQYAPILDEVLKAESKTAILNGANSNIQFVGGDTVKIYKTSVNGLGDYDRNAGYVDGSVTGEWETLKLTQDRGRRFLLDVMDNEEALGMPLATTMNTFLRTSVIPEVDAYRFAKYATAAINAGNSASADISVGTTDVAALVDGAIADMCDAEVPVEGNILFLSEEAYLALKAKITRVLANENGVNREVETYNNMPIVRVPKNRFATAISQLDGKSSGETAGGYSVATGAYYINFMIVNPIAVAQPVKHVEPKLISPSQNQFADGWLAMYRLYHDAFVLDNKAKGIYVHKKATVIS